MASDVSPSPPFWVLHSVGWLALGVAMGVAVLPDAFHPMLSLADKMAFAALGAVLTLAVRPLYRQLWARRLTTPVLVGAILAISLPLSAVWSALYALASSALDAVFPGIDAEWPAGAADYLNGALFYSFILVAWGVLYVAFKTRQAEQATRERLIAAEGLAHQARLQALRFQVQPHFLFNALNAISTLIAERQNDDAERMVARLADFLRTTLDSGDTLVIPLADEVDMVRQYLDVERVRFGDRIRTSVDVPAALAAVPVPPLILQPLVENALRHGVLPRVEGGAVSVSARRDGDLLRLTVQDDGPGFPPSAEASAGVGLANVRARLDALYGDAAHLRLSSAGGGRADVALPIAPSLAHPSPAP